MIYVILVTLLMLLLLGPAMILGAMLLSLIFKIIYDIIEVLV
jgi:hypothetical protein